ncbi:MAG: DUF861 domain-containing protein [Rhodospirillales bacterium]|nr:DUF861 domain-containing protein [Rhodospirillales bacterium]MDE1882909.1 DUF861 domain-containing protein [Rhodospirillales bacterium]MDE2390096.1 DUF861 domain-containing protein [Rhodospirillales bacterium]MDE2457903.1 DUF861 domain-containing protein [Rhodospirillales bacterium]
MLAFKLGSAVPTLDVWGRPEDIGAETLDGPMQVSGKLLFGTLETPVSGGFYAASHGRYRVTYPFHEHATLLEGELRLTDVSTGQSETYGAGDSWIIAKGTTIIWHVLSPRILKSYICATTDL